MLHNITKRLCLLTVLGIMSAVNAMAQTGYNGETLPAAPEVNGDVWNVTAANAQYTLDGAYGSIDGKTINFTENITTALELGRPTKYEGSNSKYYRHAFNTEERTLEFMIENKGKVVDGDYTPYYTRTISNVTFTANDGVTLQGFKTSAGAHVYGAGQHDYVLDYIQETEGSLYYFATKIDGVTFNGITFTASVNNETSLTSNVEMKNFTFTNCTFNIGSTESGSYAIRYYSEDNTSIIASDLVVENCTFNTVFQGVYTQHVKNITVNGCTFNTTGHNAVAVQSGDVAYNHGAVVITNNTGTGIGDRCFRLNNVGSDTQFTIIGNNFTIADGKDEEWIKATTLADGITYNVSGNTWNGFKAAANNEFNTSVAKIGSTEYATLQAAVDAAESGATITLLKDFTLTTKTSDVHSVVINKSLTIDGGGYTITSPTDRRPLAVSGKGNDITIKNLTVVNMYQTACLNFLDELTCTLDNVTLDNSSAGGSYNQPITINSTIVGTGKVTLNITNGSVVKTNDDGKAHYAIIVWHPADITITNSTIKGWAAVYVKPQGAGTSTTISNSTLESHGYSGYSNAFGMFVTESGNNSFTLTDNTYKITAEDNYDVLFMLNGNTNNVIQLLGNSSFVTNQPFYGGLAMSYGDFYVSDLYMDETNKTLFESYLTDCEVNKVSEDPYSGLYKVGYIPQVHYYWDTESGQDGGYYDFAEPFKNGWLSDGEYIDLNKDFSLTENIACTLTTGKSFKLTFGEYAITKGEYSVSLNDGVTVKTDKQTDIFSAVTESSVVVEKSVSGGYEYTVVDGTEYTITGFADENGNKVEASAEKAIVDTEITLTITTADGYTLTAVSADNGATLAAVEGDATKRTFTMPAGNVTIKAEFAQTESIDETTQTVEEGTKVDNSNATITNVEVASETETTTVTVSGTVDGAPVTEIADGAFASLAGTAVESVDLTATQVALTGDRSTSEVLKDIPETALIYLPATSSVSGDNVVIKDAESNYTCNNFVMVDEKSYSVPTAFTATTAKLERSFTASVTCTVCLPYAVDAANINGKIYRFTSIDGTTMKMTEDNDGLDANVPYIYVPDGTDNISQSSITVQITDDATATANNFTFTGVYSDKTFSADEIAAGIYGFSAEAAHGATSVGQFVKGSDGAYIKGMRAYLKYTGTGSDPGLDAYGARADEQVELPDHFDVVLVDADGTTTNIGRMELTTDEDGAPAYNLNGQRVVNSMRGIIIKNGKKTFVK